MNRIDIVFFISFDKDVFDGIYEFSLEYARYHPIRNLFAVCLPARSVLSRALLFISENPGSVSFSVVDLYQADLWTRRIKRNQKYAKGSTP